MARSTNSLSFSKHVNQKMDFGLNATYWVYPKKGLHVSEFIPINYFPYNDVLNVKPLTYRCNQLVSQFERMLPFI